MDKFFKNRVMRNYSKQRNDLTAILVKPLQYAVENFKFKNHHKPLRSNLFSETYFQSCVVDFIEI